MKKELQEKLFTKYPKIFRQKDLSMRETCMCWGIECGDGWYWLINHLCENLQFNTDHNNSGHNEGSYPQIETVQVKEKLGGLRFYTNGETKEQCAIISWAESLSYHICEYCGTTKNIGITQGWMSTICKDCHSKIENRKDLIWKQNETN